MVCAEFMATKLFDEKSDSVPLRLMLSVLTLYAKGCLEVYFVII